MAAHRSGRAPLRGDPGAPAGAEPGGGVEAARDDRPSRRPSRGRQLSARRLAPRRARARTRPWTLGGRRPRDRKAAQRHGSRALRDAFAAGGGCPVDVEVRRHHGQPCQKESCDQQRVPGPSDWDALVLTPSPISGAVKPDTAGNSRARCACNSEVLWMSVRDRACPLAFSLVYPSRTRGWSSDHKTDNAHSRGSLFSRRSGACGCGASWGSMTTSGTFAGSSCSTAARFASRSAACCSVASLPWRIGATRTPRGSHRVAFRIAQTIASFVDESRAVPVGSPDPKTCPTDLSRDSTLDVVEQKPPGAYTRTPIRVRARSSVSLIVSLRPTSVARATSSAESSARASSTNSRPAFRRSRR